MILIPEIDQRARLDPVTLVILTDAIAGDEVASMALQDRLEEEGRTLALDAWKWVIANGKKPNKWGQTSSTFTWYGASTIFRVQNESATLPESTRGDKFDMKFWELWPSFPDEFTAYHWLLVEWDRWDKWSCSL